MSACVSVTLTKNLYAPCQEIKRLHSGPYRCIDAVPICSAIPLQPSVQ